MSALAQDVLQYDKWYEAAAHEAAVIFKYGDIIPKQWMLDKFGITVPKIGNKKDFEKYAFEFMFSCEKFKTILLEEYKMFLVPHKGQGYRIVAPGAQADEAMTIFLNSFKKAASKAASVLSNVNVGLIDREESRRRDDHIGRLAAISAFTKNKLL